MLLFYILCLNYNFLLFCYIFINISKKKWIERKEDENVFHQFLKHMTRMSCPLIRSLLMSSLHHNNSIDNSSGEKQKSEINTYYNSIKYGVDMADELVVRYIII